MLLFNAQTLSLVLAPQICSAGAYHRSQSLQAGFSAWKQ